MTRDHSLLIVGGQTALGLASHFGRDQDVTAVTDDQAVVKNAHTVHIDVRTAEITRSDQLKPIADGIETTEHSGSRAE